MDQLKTMTKREILARVGNIAQLAGVTRRQVVEGNADGIRLWEVKNGSGLEFSVLESKCMDLFSMTYKGVPIEYISKNGMVSPLRFVPQGPSESLRSIGGGILYTCGLSNVGFACRTEDGEQVYHGRLRAMSSNNTAAVGQWDGDDYRIELRGEMRETAMFAENLVLRRTITTHLGEPRILIEDEVENEGFEERPFMILYHLNIGYPLLDDGAQLVLPPSQITVRDEWTEQEIPNYLKMTGPEEDFIEQVFYHSLQTAGEAVSALVNHKMQLAFYIKQNVCELPYIHEWKAFHSGDYALGLEPANCHCEGRLAEEQKYHTLQTIKPFEIKKIRLEIGILDGQEQIGRLLQGGMV